MCAKLSLIIGGLSGFLSVGLGAFAAHALKNRLDAYSLGVFQTGVTYQFYHSLALLVMGLLLIQFPTQAHFKNSAWAFVVGILIFSGSLYTLAFSGQKFWGAVTPFGGLSFFVGWILLAVGVNEAL